jgi:hypothetical protein
MTMLDELLDELRRRGWPEPAVKRGWAATVYWGGPRSTMLVMGLSSAIAIWCGRDFSNWDSALEAADGLDRLRAGLAPGEIPCLDQVRPASQREIEIEGVRIVGPDA